MAIEQPELAIVIGAQNAHCTIGECLRTVSAQVSRLHAEIIVADSSTDGTTDIITTHFPGVILIHGGPQHLIPHLWGLGISRATAPIVAIISAHCIPAEDWVANILTVASTHRQYAGVGGPIEGPDDGSLMDWAVYFSRYTVFMPPVSSGTVAEIAGDNAVYRKQALEDSWTDKEDGFWETLFHHQLRTINEQLYMSSDIRVKLGPTSSAWDFFYSRFLHGRHYGSTRPGTSFVGRVLRSIAAPILMPFLVLRNGQRVAKYRPDWLPTYILALPWLTFFLGGWSLGEASGYLWPQR